MTHVLQPQSRTQRTQPAIWRRLPALLCALATILSLALSACANVVVLPGNRTPTPALPAACNRSGEAPLRAPGYNLPVTLPLVADGVVYVGYALTDHTSADLWQSSAGRFALAALRERDGAPLWRIPTARGIWPYTVTGAWPLVVADGVLIAFDTGLDASGLAGLIGLRASDGAMLWRTPLATRSVTASDGVLYVSANNAVYALRIVDGHTLWRTPVSGAPLSAPLVAGASLYIASTYGALVALRADTGAVRWTTVLDPVSPPFGEYLPLEMVAGWLYVYAPIDPPHGIVAGVLRVNPTSGASQGYTLRLPASTTAVNPTMLAGIFYALLLSSGAPAPEPPPTVVAYRLSASGGWQFLWSAPLQRSQVFLLGMATHDAQTFYLLAGNPSWMIFGFRLSDGALLWRQQALANGMTGFTVGAGDLFETEYGLVTPCHTPPIDQAPQILALKSADGSVAWTRVLDATL